MQEAFGLRVSGLTVLVPQYVAKATVIQSNAVLVMAAAINLSLAAAVLFFARNSGAKASSATGGGAV